MISTRDKIIERMLRWMYAMIGMEYSRSYRYDWYKTGSTDCSGYVFAGWLAGLFPLTGIKGMTSMYEVYADGFDLMFPRSYDLIGKDGQWAPKGFYKGFGWKDGDTVFVNFDRNTSRANKITHVMMYAGGKWIHTANTKENACEKELSYGDGRILAVIRLKADAKEFVLPETTQASATTMVTRIMQAWLNYHGAVLRCDGSWGPKTTDALKTFKLANRLGNDGTSIDAVVWSVLVGAGQTAVVAPRWTCSRTLTLSVPRMKGADVYNLELALEAQGYSCNMSATEHKTGIGNFGTGCDKALRAWQAKNPDCGGKNGKQDGRGGPKSITKLGGVWTGK